MMFLCRAAASLLLVVAMLSLACMAIAHDSAESMWPFAVVFIACLALEVPLFHWHLSLDMARMEAERAERVNDVANARANRRRRRRADQ